MISKQNTLKNKIQKANKQTKFKTLINEKRVIHKLKNEQKSGLCIDILPPPEE